MNGVSVQYEIVKPFQFIAEMKKNNKWRREGDSNSRGALTPTRFRGAHLQPLGHLSVAYRTELFFYYFDSPL